MEVLHVRGNAGTRCRENPRSLERAKLVVISSSTTVPIQPRQDSEAFRIVLHGRVSRLFV